ncbi:MAG: hypothetical protein JWL75_160 [Parcubacteria group bacterium]|nr:hypothetical protein [Parcubacteria group bacterium]
MYTKLRTYLHKRILWQLAVIFIAAVFLLIAVIRDAVVGDISVVPILIAMIVGLGVGYLSGRIFGLAWHAETSKVIMTMDKMSIILIVLYIIFRVFSAQILGDYYNGETLSALSFAVLDGLLIGRLVSMWRRIRVIWIEQGI